MMRNPKPSVICVNVLLLFFAAVFLTRSTLSQSPLLTNPSSLSQFPSVEQLRAGSKGTDDVDGHARFMAALWRINTLIIDDLVTASNGGKYDLPPAAETVHYRYSNAITKFGIDQPPPAARDPRYRPLEDRYEKDPAFLDNLLSQFFAPKFRTDYYAWVRKPVPQASAAGAAGPVKATVDPSITKAKAAKVDLSVFGLEIGQPVQLPECADFEVNQATCVSNPNGDFLGKGLLETLMGVPPGALAPGFDPNFLDIMLDQAHCPDWMSGCNVRLMMQDGRLIGITTATSGRSVEKSVNAELKEKYGPPTGVFSGKITPDVECF